MFLMVVFLFVPPKLYKKKWKKTTPMAKYIFFLETHRDNQ